MFVKSLNIIARQGVVTSQNDAQLMSDLALIFRINKDEFESNFLATSIYMGLLSVFLNERE